MMAYHLAQKHLKILQVDGDIPNEYEWPVPLGSFMNLMKKWTNKPTSQSENNTSKDNGPKKQD